MYDFYWQHYIFFLKTIFTNYFKTREKVFYCRLYSYCVHFFSPCMCDNCVWQLKRRKLYKNKKHPNGLRTWFGLRCTQWGFPSSKFGRQSQYELPSIAVRKTFRGSYVVCNGETVCSITVDYRVKLVGNQNISIKIPLFFFLIDDLRAFNRVFTCCCVATTAADALLSSIDRLW